MSAMGVGALAATLLLGSAFALSHLDSEQQQARQEAVALPAPVVKEAMVSHTTVFSAGAYDLNATGAVDLDSTDNTDVEALMGPFTSAQDFCALHYAQELKEEPAFKCVEYKLKAAEQPVILIAVGEDPTLKPDGYVDYFVATSSTKGWMASHWKTRTFKASSKSKALVTDSVRKAAPAFAISVHSKHAASLSR